MPTPTTTLSDTFAHRGHWWLPETPDKTVAGLLKFDPHGGITLVLDGILRDIPKGEYKGLFVPLILGRTLNGKACTLLDAHDTNLQMHSSGNVTMNFSSQHLFIGKEFVKSKEAVFESVRIELAGLSGWLQRDPFKDEHDVASDERAKVSTTYVMPKRISIPVKSLQATIHFVSTVNKKYERDARIIRNTESVLIRPKKKQSLEWFLDVVFKFRILISLFAAEPVNITSIKFCSKKRKLPGLGDKLYREYLDFCLKLAGASMSKALLPPEIPFTYPLIRRNRRVIFETWFSKASALETTCGLYFGVTVNRNTPVEFQFLALIQALEAFHRASGTDKYVSDESYAPVQTALVNAIPSSVESDFRAAMKSRLRFGNEYSLRKRLTLIFRGVPDELRAFITNNDPRFVERVVVTRNYLTHRDESQKDDVMEFAAIFNASESLKLLLAFLLLTETGLENRKVAEVILSHWKYKNRPRLETSAKK